MAAIDSVYNYYLSTYGTMSGMSRYDTHKKSELRDTYNRIVKSNKDSPLYKINLDDESMKRFAIDLKEGARSAKNVVSSLSTDESGMEAIFHKKIATSSNPASVQAEFIGDSEQAEGGTSFTIEVAELAKPQVNTGNFLTPGGHDFEAGAYTFDLDITSNSYEFQFTVESGDSNYQVQSKIARLINVSDVGLSASIIDNDRKQTALQITSKQTGLAEDETEIFKIQSGTSWNELNRLGINQVTSEASNSSFTLNGSPRSSLSNSFTINKEFEITLLAPSEESATIGFKANTDAIADSASELLRAYNGLLDVGRQYSNGHNSNKLFNEVAAVSSTMEDELSSVGISILEDQSLSLDRDKMSDAVTGDSAEESFRILNKFKNSIAREADKVAVNPMNYVDKLIVEYKNPASNFSAPYAQSQYAGLILNQYL